MRILSEIVSEFAVGSSPNDQNRSTTLLSTRYLKTITFWDVFEMSVVSSDMTAIKSARFTSSLIKSLHTSNIMFSNSF